MTLQYFKPAGRFFVGDCMPFFHDGVFRLYYLLDEGHFGAPNGLGGHQWAQASTTDLVQWTGHPLAIPLTDPREGAICTGSVFFHNGLYYGFYATRLRDSRQQVNLAVSRDGVAFTKRGLDPLLAPPAGFDPFHYRDPVVFRDPDTGLFHLLVSALLNPYPVAGRGGCLDRWTSEDLARWTHAPEPFLIPGFADVPECPDYFFWNAWYYLVFSNGGVARYRMSRRPLGPWSRPEADALDGGFSRVMKTASFAGNRRIGVSWVGGRVGGKDNGAQEFAGNAVFRELVQHDDGTLGTRFLPEMLPPEPTASCPAPLALTPGAEAAPGRVRLRPEAGLAAARLDSVPANFRLTADIPRASGRGLFGLRLRYGSPDAAGRIRAGYDLSFDLTEQALRLNAQGLSRLGPDARAPFRLDVIAWDSLIDVCLNNRRCLIDRCPEQRGGSVLFSAWDADAQFESVRIAPLEPGAFDPAPSPAATGT